MDAVERSVAYVLVVSVQIFVQPKKGLLLMRWSLSWQHDPIREAGIVFG